jgi:hypothetical protein
MPKPTPQKCLDCACLTIAQVRSLHGSDGDQCYQRSCDSKRSRLRARDQINLKRRKQNAVATGKIEIDHPSVVSAHLHTWREDRAFSPVHAIGCTVWRDNDQILEIAPIHCAGYMPAQVEGYVESMLIRLYQDFALTRFESQIIQTPDRCPLAPCPLRYEFPRIAGLPR